MTSLRKKLEKYFMRKIVR